MANEKKLNKLPRGHRPHTRLEETTVASVWSDSGLIAADPFDDIVGEAVDQASSRVMNYRQRKEAEFQARQQARQQAQPEGPAATAAAELTAEALQAQAQAYVEQLGPEERAALDEALLQKSFEAGQVPELEALREDQDFNFEDSFEDQSDYAAALEYQDGLS